MLLIRFDHVDRLKELQQGSFYMKNSLHYQKTDNADLARSDPFDGSIPFPDINGVMKTISGRETKNERIILLNTFIKCFFHCKKNDFQPIGNEMYKFTFSDEEKRAIYDFNVEGAMLLFSWKSFLEQVENACCQNCEEVFFGDVIYVDEEGYNKAIQLLKENYNERYYIPFYKNIRFCNQKEFRICVHHSFGLNANMSVYDVRGEKAKEIDDLSYSFNIGEIKDSCIVNIDKLLNKGILLDKRNDHFYVCDE